MAVQEGTEDVYASLLLTDTYLPGALVLAHSLRDAGTTKKLAILITPDTVSKEVINQLKTVYDYVIPVERVRNERPANLFLMNRPDLHSAFTKIALWKQTQFRKIVYIDADVVAYRAPDELFHLPHSFSAAPDIGWPDLFNTGVMALTPNMGDYYALSAMAERGISFDGADQGLLNMHFRNTYNRLSFSYNVTPSAHYQYVPAYRHLSSSISMVHFIGSEKPWVQGRQASTTGTPFDEMVGRWWAVYDRHYRRSNTSTPPPEIVQYFVKGEYNPTTTYVVPVGEPADKTVKSESWDASRHSPPIDSGPEAANFPQAHYNMSSDATPYVASAEYLPERDRPTPIFPWEANQPKPTRVFPERPLDPVPPKSPQTPRITQTSQLSTPATGTLSVHPAPSAGGNTWTNAWDEVPQINRYVETVSSKHQRTRSQGLGVVSSTAEEESKISKVTDFPSEEDRPSLPVTPAPVGRLATGVDESELPAADGVPEQAEWDPSARLDNLARQHLEAFELLKKLSSGGSQPDETIGVHHREIPSRPLPFGSENVKSPTYVPFSPPNVVSPQPVKPPSTTTGVPPAIRVLAGSPDVLPSASSSSPLGISPPSYQGPGPAFEKGEP
ncbi:nucleotide-diphospho-sugar transferase [Podospora fimiseda]|uniref:glycogenin glucosyltransferase n=1 Tax=Podospora fimiseda TaxID=252190 RepID=A0AAN7H5P5_9PEZI|nr:nucleotide-diphospho-sugar transferase [Podospora fimiseda]